MPAGVARSSRPTRAVGIETEIIPVEWAQWLKAVFKGDDFDLTIVSHTEPLDIEIYARDKYYFNYDSAEYKAVIKELAAEDDPDKRTALMQQAQRILADDAVNGFLFELAQHGVWPASCAAFGRTGRFRRMMSQRPIGSTDWRHR